MPGWDQYLQEEEEWAKWRLEEALATSTKPRPRNAIEDVPMTIATSGWRKPGTVCRCIPLSAPLPLSRLQDHICDKTDNFCACLCQECGKRLPAVEAYWYNRLV